MEYTTATGMMDMPAHYALISEEEMVYLDGGAFPSISQEQLIQFGVNVLVNGLMFISGSFFTAGVAMLSNAFVGTTITTGGKIMKDFFSSLNAKQWGFLAVAGIMGGFYGLSMAAYYYTSLIDPLIKAFQESFLTTPAEAQPAAAAA